MGKISALTTSRIHLNFQPFSVTDHSESCNPVSCPWRHLYDMIFFYLSCDALLIQGAPSREVMVATIQKSSSYPFITNFAGFSIHLPPSLTLSFVLLPFPPFLQHMWYSPSWHTCCLVLWCTLVLPVSPLAFFSRVYYHLNILFCNSRFYSFCS